MSPQGKADVIRAMQERNGHHVLMCGDGGNDVGALKQADVGLALLGGYGNMNTSESAAETLVGKKKDKALLDAESQPTAEEALNHQSVVLQKRAAESQKLRKAALAKFQKDLQAKQPAWLKEEIERRQREGETGFMLYPSAMKAIVLRMKNEVQKEAQRLNVKHGNVFDGKDGGKGKDEGDGHDGPHKENNISHLRFRVRRHHAFQVDQVLAQYGNRAAHCKHSDENARPRDGKSCHE